MQDAIKAVELGTIPNPITVGPGDYPTIATVSRTVTIKGVGAGSDPTANTILDGGNVGELSPVLTVQGNLALSGVELTKANGGAGGGIFNEAAGTVNFDSGSAVSISGNTADTEGGGIFNEGTVNFDAGSNVSIVGNDSGGGPGSGGGIFNFGTLTFVPGSAVSITGNFPDDCDGLGCP